MTLLASVVAILIADEERQLRARLSRSETSGIAALTAALDTRDRYTGEHSRTVVRLATAVARRLGLDERTLDAIAQVAVLHDIGKVGIPDSILQKQGPLDDTEWALMRQHPVVGERVVAGTTGLSHLAPAMRAEHERWDGGGYPDGLRGTAIPIAARITLACDAFDAMTTDRPYRSALTHSQAVAELRACAGTQFDPDVVAALLEVVDCTPAAAGSAEPIA